MPVVPAPAQRSHAAVDRAALAIVRLVNGVRGRHRLRPLRLSRSLNVVAGEHSWDMLRHNAFSHDSSDGTPFARRLRRHTHARSIGETIAWTRGRARPSVIVREWLDSSVHRAELLSPKFRSIGVGRARGRRMTFVTADFAGR